MLGELRRGQAAAVVDRVALDPATVAESLHASTSRSRFKVCSRAAVPGACPMRPLQFFAGSLETQFSLPTWAQSISTTSGVHDLRCA